MQGTLLALGRLVDRVQKLIGLAPSDRDNVEAGSGELSRDPEADTATASGHQGIKHTDEPICRMPRPPARVPPATLPGLDGEAVDLDRVREPDV